MDNEEIPLERGMQYFFENQGEFERKEMPIEKQAAICFEAGRQLGRCEIKLQVSRQFIPNKGPVWA